MPMTDYSKEFAQFYNDLQKRWRECESDLSQFTEYELQTIALEQFNGDYGANGLIDHVALHRRSLLEETVRGLYAIGAHRLAAIVARYFELLELNGFDDTESDVYDFIDSLSIESQNQLDELQTEAADLYSDFYDRWEQYFIKMQTDSSKGTNA